MDFVVEKTNIVVVVVVAAVAVVVAVVDERAREVAARQTAKKKQEASIENDAKTRYVGYATMELDAVVVVVGGVVVGVVVAVVEEEGEVNYWIAIAIEEELAVAARVAFPKQFVATYS